MIKLFQGQQLNIEYTATADIAAGEGVLIGAEIWVAPNAILNGAVGTLDAGKGMAVYKVPKDGTAGPVFAVGDILELDVASQLAVADAGGDADFGVCVEPAGASDDYVLIRKG